MTSRLRFTSAGQIFETFPTASRTIATPPGDEPPLAFLRRLADSKRPFDALVFGAYLLPRREAVWWACQCVRAISGEAPPDAALKAAEAWVRDPEEATRRAALELGNAGDKARASTWLARGAGWSGGSISPVDPPPLIATQPGIALRPVNAAPHMTAKALIAALDFALAGAGAIPRPLWIAACAQSCIRFAEGGEPRPRLAAPARP